MSKIVDAVSIVLTCGDQMFAIQRQFFLRAFPGYWAFPGGKVEEGDDLHAPDHVLLKQLDARLFGAVVREGEEELGINIGVELEKGSINRVDFLGLAITPDFNPYRFATYFFRIDFKHKVDFKIDRNEARIAQWMSAAQLLEQYNSGQVLAVPPVIKVIQTLGSNPQVSHIEDLNFNYDSTQFVPYIESLKSVRQIMPLSNTLPPATRTNAFLIGDDDGPYVLVDPSPKSDEEYQKFKNTLALFRVDKIFITHHHPDHYERSTQLAREYGVPVLLSADTFERLSQRQPSLFNDLVIDLAKEGDVVTQWLGKDVLVYEVPGHDEGQLALAPRDLSWFLAGDLFQGVGTVVIGGPEGDMQKYFKTLEKIIRLNPKVVFPSHGIGLGGVSILERTLEHRKVREQQVLTMHQQGKQPQEMLEEIYREVDKKLWPYAAQNIQKHLDKLKAEKKI
jgi:endoribonuclease LACTB2